jgi:hypothetical protein
LNGFLIILEIKPIIVSPVLVERICIIWLICTLFNHSSLSTFTVIFPVSTLWTFPK